MPAKLYSLALTDAERYLQTLGPAYPGEKQLLPVGYDDGKEGKESKGKYINGASFQFVKGPDQFLQVKPVIKFASTPQVGAKSTLIMIDPDAPDRAGSHDEDRPDGTKCGEKGPWLHWLVTGCGETCADGKEQISYQGPAPPKGKHRYIFIELEEKAEPIVKVKMERARWDIHQFLRDNKGRLEPVAINFFYCSATQADSEIEYGPRIKDDGTSGPSGLKEDPYKDSPWLKTKAEGGKLPNPGEPGYQGR